MGFLIPNLLYKSEVITMIGNPQPQPQPVYFFNLCVGERGAGRQTERFLVRLGLGEVERHRHKVRADNKNPKQSQVAQLDFHKVKVKINFSSLYGKVYEWFFCGINHRRLNIEDRRKNRTTLA
jgi:hypothetical protein